MRLSDLPDCIGFFPLFKSKKGPHCFHVLFKFSSAGGYTCTECVFYPPVFITHGCFSEGFSESLRKQDSIYRELTASQLENIFG